MILVLNRDWSPYFLRKTDFVEAVLSLQDVHHTLVDGGFRHQNEVVQQREWGVDTVDSAMCLMPNPVRIRQRVEQSRVGFRTIPAFRSRRVLHEIDPPIPIRNLLVLMTIPLSRRIVLR
jgi:hypothetical protein